MARCTEQTFIICLENEQGRSVNFERWSYKRLSTCISKMVLLYKELKKYSFVMEELNKTIRVVAYKSDETTNYCTDGKNKVWSISIDEFLQMIA